MTTFVLANCFNEAHNLPRMWESCQLLGEVVLVVVDGRYPDYDGEDDFSTDGTKEFAETHGHYVRVSDYECEKRTAGLRYIDHLAHRGDYVLVLDADEELTSIFAWPERVGQINFTRMTRNKVPYGRCRLYAWEPGLEFKHRHYDLYDVTGELVSSLEDAPDYQVVGTGNHYETRPKTPEQLAYYKTLRSREDHPAVAANG